MPDCTGKVCGDDACGGTCGECASGQACSADGTACECVPDCTGKVCGDDACGGTCGECASGQACSADGTACECAPDCTGKICGDDACGGTCGECASGQACSADGTACECVPDCNGAVCGDDGCGGSCSADTPTIACADVFTGVTNEGGATALNNATWGGCAVNEEYDGPEIGWVFTPTQDSVATFEQTNDPAFGGIGGVGDDVDLFVIEADDANMCSPSPTACLNATAFHTAVFNAVAGKTYYLIMDGWTSGGGSGIVNPIDVSLTCCTPDCAGKLCGDDGCGGTCGECADGDACNEGACCTPDCAGKVCGDDGCGGTCGECAAGDTCTVGTCCTPDCTGKLCGGDGCGGSCGGDAPTIACADVFTGLTNDGGPATLNTATWNGCASSEAYDGPEIGWVFTPTQDSVATFEQTNDPAFGGIGGIGDDVDLFVVEADDANMCSPSPDTCLAATRFYDAEFKAVAGKSYYLILDGWTSGGGTGIVNPIDVSLTCCFPACDNLSCDITDGCGGTCGCAAGDTCNAGSCCTPDCAGKLCGDDGCGGSCGACNAGDTCNQGACCTPDCTGKLCGDDGCGGGCGEDVPTIACADVFTGLTNDGGLTTLNNATWNGCAGAEDYEGPEIGWVFTPTEDVAASFVQTNDPLLTGAAAVADDLDLFVVEADAVDMCLPSPAACLTATTLHTADFNAFAGKSYYLILDGWTGGGGTGIVNPIDVSLTCCVRSCDKVSCGGADGCGGTCGCADGDTCNAGSCCTPACAPGVCGAGSDGCGGQCACDAGLVCGVDNQCAPPGQGNDCSDPLVATGALPITLTGDTDLFFDSFTGGDTCATNFGNGSGVADAVYEWTPDETGAYTFTLDVGGSGAAPSFLHYRTACDGACDGASGDLYQGGAVTWTLTGGTTYHIIVDGQFSEEAGPYTLTISGPAP
ncbi:MAG: hypothetical protein R3F39_10855 [Myxococcota bacterium]